MKIGVLRTRMALTAAGALAMYLSNCRRFDDGDVDRSATDNGGASGGQLQIGSAGLATGGRLPSARNSVGLRPTSTVNAGASAGGDGQAGALAVASVAGSTAQAGAPMETKSGGDEGAGGRPAERVATTWHQIVGVSAHAAVASGGTIYALGDTWLDTQGWRIQQTSFDNGVWKYADSAAGTNLALSSTGDLWAYGLNSLVWRRAPDVGWVSLPPVACEAGGVVALRQLPAHNSLAVVALVPFAITDAGRIRFWTGSCWELMAALPHGSANEIAVYRDGAFPWVADGNGAICHWDGTSWISIDAGITTALNNQGIGTGSDSKSLWSFSGIDWSRLTWDNGTIIQLGSTLNRGAANEVQQIAVTNDEQIWVLGWR